MMQVEFQIIRYDRDEYGDETEVIDTLGEVECDVTPFKTELIDGVSNATTKVFLYEVAFTHATHFKTKDTTFEITNLNDYNDEQILCFVGKKVIRK